MSGVGKTGVNTDVNIKAAQAADNAVKNEPAKTQQAESKPEIKGETLKTTAAPAGKVPAGDTKINFGAAEEVKPAADKPEKERRVTERKGTLAVGWGYGREIYAPSDMHFKGQGHDFTVSGVKAQDRPSPFSFDTYFNPAKLSIPQYMMDVTYFPTDNIYIDFNPNHHMKWVSEADQMVKITGTITPEASPELAGDYNGEYINMNKIFKRLEHTDGYNYVNVGVGVIHPLWESKNGKHALSIKGGVHGGAIVTRSDVNMFGQGANHPFKLDGFGYGAKAGVRLDVFKNFFVEGNSEFIRGHVSGFKTTGKPGDSGSHTIDGVNNYFTVGYQGPIGNFNPANWFGKK